MGDNSFLSLFYHGQPGQDVFGKDMIFNLASVVDWRVVTVAKQRQIDIDNFRENAK